MQSGNTRQNAPPLIMTLIHSDQSQRALFSERNNKLGQSQSTEVGFQLRNSRLKKLAVENIFILER